ncbi:MAG TPA: amino acid adenylation domain-containing protein [Streptosporangiaceae bacterium]
MNHLEVLREVERRGLRLSVSGSDLRLQGPQQRLDAELLGQIRAAKADLLAHLSDGVSGGFPLTLLQRGYLIGRGGSVEMGNIASHVYHEIDGCWDIDRLESALRQVVARHGMLRTRFTADGRQITLAVAEVRLGRLDLRGQSFEAQETRLRALREQRSHRVLPSDRAPMLAADVTLLADDRMRLHVGHDGLVMDGISMFLFFADWWRAYSGDSAGGADSGVSFADYVASLEKMRASAAGQRSRDYWLGRLDDLPPYPGLPLRTSPSAITQPRFVQHSARLDQSSWAALKARAASAGVTPTVALLTAYAETLARWGAGRRFTLTTTVASRPPIHPRITEAIGNFSETMLIEIGLDRQATFAERARALQARMRTDLDHRHFSGIEVLRELARRDPGGQARMPFTFNSAIGYVRDGVNGSALELFGPEVYTSSQTPQVWLNGFAFEQHGGVIVQFDEVAGLFPDGMIAAMVNGYAELIASLSSGTAWSATTFDLLPADQRARRRAANNTSGPVPEHLLPAAFAAQAARAPDAPAVLTCDAAVSYGELFRRAADAARWLRARDVGRDELVALVMRRGPEQVVGIMGALMAGGAYLPVDATLPSERVRYMLRDGRVRCVLTNTGWRADDGPADVFDIDLGRDLPAGPAGFEWTPLPDASPDDLAYVLYTSGTTGEPKGVMVSHRSVANVVADCNARFGVGPGDHFMAISAFNFDLSVYDVFGALSAGAALVVPDADRAADPAHWLELCGRFGVTVWNSVPAIVRLLAEQADSDGGAGLETLRLVMMSGDRIPATLPAALRKVLPDGQLISLGGPTETTIWNVWHPIDEDGEDGGRIPYGRPNANNRAYILDADGLDAPDWVTGEICAAGTGLARGYWGDPARTAAKFYTDDRLAERIYRTGDLGRYLPDGAIDILGRSDFQIKINGYRIEAGEVETRLTSVATIKQAVVVRQSGSSGERLVAHLVPAGERPEDEQIRQALVTHLPSYMVPSVIVWHESLPLTRNGKVDRARLVDQGVPMALTIPSERADGAIGTLGKDLAALWAPVLGVPDSDIGLDTDFFDLGGDSLAAARIFTAVRKRFGVSITLDHLHRVRTIREMARQISEQSVGDNS